MSLLLTKNCHYAVMVAIENGQHFQEQHDKDVYVTSRLNLKLPRPVDDLIPPTTLISTKPTILSTRPEWRTTLVYYISRQILSRLIQRQAQINLEVATLSEKGERECIGSMILQMDEAKLITMKQKTDLTLIQQYIVDKGDWLSISENNRSRVKAGLFLTEIPSNNINLKDKAVGTPLQSPIKTSHDFELEICSDISELFLNEEEEDEELLLLDEDEDKEDYEQDMMSNIQKDEEEEDYYIPIGNGQDQYSFLFRVMEANHISSITKKYSNNVNAYFQYEFADKQYQCNVDYDIDTWQALEYANNIMLQGDLDDILNWLNEQSFITVCLIIEDEQGKQEIIGFSEIYLTGKDLGVINQSTLIYDCEKTWHINSDKQFSKLQLQIGLGRGWDEYDDFIEKD